MTDFIIFFNNINSSDLLKVGGKGANLGELTKAGFEVPPGFCLTTKAFTAFIAKATEDIYLRLNDVSPDNLEHLRDVGRSIRSYLSGVPVPEGIEKALVEAWKNLGENHAYAIRSSATAEDLPNASFAGQQDTYLNIRGKDQIVTKAKACLISLFTDRAILYRIQNGFDHRKVAISVIVQRMVEPHVSGILFTADPVSGNRNTVSIDASFGLGEALVSGIVSADLYQVNKHTKKISKRQIATKNIAIRPLGEGGTEQIELNEEDRDKQALSDEQIVSLAKLGIRIEAHYGTPQDIEWALEGDTLFITQSRPITSLYPLPEPRPGDEDLHIYFSLSHFQVMTNAMPPLSLSVIRTLIPFGRKPGQIESRSMKTAGGRLYADLAPILRHPLGRRILLKAFKNADQLAVSALSELVKRPEFQTHGKRFNPLRIMPFVLPYLVKSIGMLLWGRPEGVSEKALVLIDKFTSDLESKLGSVNELSERLKIAVDELQQLKRPVLTWVPFWIAGVISDTLLKTILINKADPDDLISIERGLKGNVVTEMNLAVGDLADVARSSNAVEKVLSQKNIDAKTRLENLASLPEGKTFLKQWNKFIHTYGARGPSEIDLSQPRWSEDPASVLQMVVNAMGQSQKGAHRIHYQQLITEGESAANNLIAVALKGRWGKLWGLLTKRLIYVARNLTPLREHHKFLAIRVLEILKRVLVDAGDQLQKRGRLNSSKDIWFLSLPEVIEALETDQKDLKDLVLIRRSVFEHYQSLTPPRVITSEGEVPAVHLNLPEAPEGALFGSPVSAGVVEGVAKIVLDPSEEALNPGEILVAPFTDPGWTPLFVNAGGLITEVGGMMTHGSVVAREYGIPAVVGVIDATKQIKTGQKIRVHGNKGYVEFIDH